MIHTSWAGQLAELVTRLGYRAAAAGICPQAPPGTQAYANEVTAWVKWAVLVILGICFFASVGMLIWGRVTHHPKGARLGFDGLMICFVAAILYVVGYVVVTSIVGNGC